jgi:hypothetical protein
LILIRLAALIFGLALLALVAAWLIKGDRRYLAMAGKLLRFALTFAAVLAVLYVVERLVLR